MSLVPMLFSDCLEDLDRPHRILEQYLDVNPLVWDMSLTAEDPEFYWYRPRRRRRRYHPFLRNLQPRGRLPRNTSDDRDKFLVTLDVQQFAPEEITVKVVDRNIVVEAKHCEREDEHGWISRQFVRKYAVPAQWDIDQVSSSLSSDGVLMITAPKREERNEITERTIRVEYTGQPAIADYTPSQRSTTAENNIPNSTGNIQHDNPSAQRIQQQASRGRKGIVKAV